MPHSQVGFTSRDDIAVCSLSSLDRKGAMAFTFDGMPHRAHADGIDYVEGCQGNGVAMMSYRGNCVARKITSTNAEPRVFDLQTSPTHPLYSGVP